jgi:hypothetical protein
MASAAPLTIGQLHIKRASRQLVDAVGGGQRGAGLCRVRQQDLSDYGNRDQAQRFMPADVVADLEGVAAYPFVTAALAAEAGYALFKLPEAGAMPGDLLGHLSHFAKEGGEVMAVIAAHAPDGITAREVRDSNLINEIDQAMAALVNMRAAAVAVISGE